MSSKPSRASQYAKHANNSQNSQKSQSTKHPKHLSISPVALSVIIIVIAIAVGVGLILRINYMHKQNMIARLQEISNSDHGSTLDEVIANVQASMPQEEIIFVFDEGGRKLVEQTSHSDRGVSLSPEAINILRRFRNLTHVHNHPYTDSGHSDNDLAMPVRIGLQDSIVTLGVIAQKHVFYMHRDTKSWPDQRTVIDYFLTLMNTYDSAIDPVWMQAITVNGQIESYFTKACLDRFAQDFGYTLEVVMPSAS